MLTRSAARAAAAAAGSDDDIVELTVPASPAAVAPTPPSDSDDEIVELSVAAAPGAPVASPGLGVFMLLLPFRSPTTRAVLVHDFLVLVSRSGVFLSPALLPSTLLLALTVHWSSFSPSLTGVCPQWRGLGPLPH